jgi:DNA-binding response OmpR family regulator
VRPTRPDPGRAPAVRSSGCSLSPGGRQPGAAPTKHILIIEDDPAIIQGLSAALRGEHYRVTGAVTGKEGLSFARRENVDLILLDLLLPDMNGYDVCQTLRRGGVQSPLIMLTCKSEEIDKVMGLELGADDYMVKPFSVRELLARVKARLRRPVERIRDLEAYNFEDVYIDFRNHEVLRSGAEVKLTSKEFKILKLLVTHEGEVVARDSILDEVWGSEKYPTSRTIDNFILSIRKGIERDYSRPKHVITVHTEGYKFVN